MQANYIKQYSESDYGFFHLFDDEYYSADLHCHNFIEIYLCISGGKHFLLNDKIFDMKRGDLFFVKSLDVHRIVRENDICYERFVLEYKPAFVLPFCTSKTDLLHYADLSNKKISLTKLQFESLLELFKRYEELNDSNYGSDVKKELYFLEILLYVATLFYDASSQKDIHFSSVNPALSSLLIYIRDNLSENLCLDHLASHVNINKYHLCKLFKKHTGITINQYISSKRIAEAKKFLIEGNSVTDAGEKSGFNNLSHFIRVFKQTTGISPTTYVKQELNK